MNKYYLVFVSLLLGLIVAFVNFQPVVPVHSEPETPYYSGIRGKNQVSITFNVDWGQKYIPDLLQIMEKREIKATFFVTGNWGRQYPDLLRQITDNGHELGNHGYSHKQPSTLAREDLKKLITQNEELIYRITGNRTNLFAPPFGEVDERITAVAAETGHKTIMWSADTIDWQKPPPEIIVQRAVNKIEDGGIILMHPTSPTVEALPEIIKRIEARGFEFVTVSRLISN